MVSGKVVRRMADLGNSIVSVLMGLLVYAILGWALLSPIVLSIRNLRGLFRPDIRYKKRIWLITVILGTGLTSIYNWLVTGTTAFGRTDAYWTEQLIGPQLHQPLCSGHRNVYVGAGNCNIVSCNGFLHFALHPAKVGCDQLDLSAEPGSHRLFADPGENIGI